MSDVRTTQDIAAVELAHGQAPSGKAARCQRAAFIAAIVSLLIVGIGWAFASPIGSSPDDDFHLGSIWCPRPVEESCDVSYVGGRKLIEVPRAASRKGIECYVFIPSVSAGCTAGFADSDRALSYRYDEGNYPKGYYHFHHLLVGSDVEGSAVRMRLVNLFFAVTLIGTIAATAPDRIRRSMSLAVAVCWFPMGVYYIVSNNPTSWAISGLFAFSTGMYAAAYSRGRRRWILIVAALLGAGMCLASRYDASFYLFVVGLALAFAVPWNIKRQWPEVALLVALALVGTYAMLSTANQGAIPTTPSDDPNAPDMGLPHFVWALATIPKYIGGFFGLYWQPGWLDVNTDEHAPYVLSLLACGGVFLLAVRAGTWRKWLGALMVFGAIVGLPAVFHATGVFPLLPSYQSRYILPLFAVLFFILLAEGMSDRPWLTRSQGLMLVTLVGTAHFLTLYITMLRFTKGTVGGQPRLMVGNLQWWWNIPVSAIAMWTLTMLAAFVFLALAVSTVRRPVLECAADTFPSVALTEDNEANLAGLKDSQ